MGILQRKKLRIQTESICYDSVVASPPLRIELTKNRNSRAVLQDNVIVVRLARGLSASQQQQHIDYLVGRMKSVWEREQGKKQIHPFSSVLLRQGTHTITFGDGTTETIIRTDDTKTSMRRRNGVWHFSWSERMSKSAAHRLLWKNIAVSRLSSITKRVHEVNAATLRLPVRSVKLRYAKTQWGSCSSHGGITLNPTLLFVPERLQTYVIVHELAHIAHHNHSARFWATVGQAFPHYKDAVKELRSYRVGKL